MVRSRRLSVNYTRPFVFSYQRAFMDCLQRFTVVEGSTKVGKTAPMIIWLFEQALQGKGGQRYWWVAPVFGQAKIAFERMRRQVSIQGFFKVNESNLTLTLPNGAVIEFKSAEKPDNLYGEDVYAAVFDEASRARETAWYALRSTLTSTKGKCKFIANVRGRGWYYKLAVKAKSGVDPEYAYYKVTAWDAVMTGGLDPELVIANRHRIVGNADTQADLDRAEKVYRNLLDYAYGPRVERDTKNRLSLAEVLQAKSDLPAHIFRELYEAEPSDDGGNPFGIQFLDAAMVDGLSTLPDHCYGVDLAKSIDFTVFVGLDVNKRVSRLTRFQLDWSLTTETLKALPDLSAHVDQTGVGNPVVEEAQKGKRNLEGFTFTKASKQPLIEALAIAIRRGEIQIPRDTPLSEELYSFEYEYTATGVRYSAPDGLHDDCVMALALAYNAYRRQPVAARPVASRPSPPKSKF